MRRSLVGCWGCLPSSNGRGHFGKTFLKLKLFTGRRELSRDWRDRHPTPRLLSAVGCTTPLPAASHEVRHCFFFAFFTKLLMMSKGRTAVFVADQTKRQENQKDVKYLNCSLSVQLPMPPTSHKVQTLVDQIEPKGESRSCQLPAMKCKH